MKRNNIARCLTLLILIIFSILISGCAHKDKEVVITSNVKKAVKQTENGVEKNINLGNKLLDSGKYDEAKQAYNKAIELDKKNKKTYLTIKDKYLSKGKLQEAYDVVQEAVTNNVDTDNMKKILSELKVNIEASKNEQDIKSQSTTKAQQPKNATANSSQTQVQEQDNSDENNTTESTSMFCIIQDVYDHDGKKYISAIPAQFFGEKDALNEAAKDGIKLDECAGYYIRKIDRLQDFQVSNNAKFDVGQYTIDIMAKGISNTPISYSNFKNIENNKKDRGLYWMYLNSNNVVVRLEAQFEP